MTQRARALEDGRTSSTAVQRPAAVPVWLAPERFEAADFSPDVCVAEYRRYVPLPTVKAELQTYLQHLKNKLVEALNEDYGDYVGLSSKLTGLEGAVVRMRHPLLEIQGKLAAVEDGIKTELQELQQGLQRRQDAASARRTLELMQEVAASTGKVEKMLEEVNQQHTTAAAAAATRGSGSGGTAAAASTEAADSGKASSSTSITAEELDSHCRILERVAGEAARLLYLVERGKQLAFVKTLERRVMGCRMSIDRQLQAALLSALQSQNWPAALHCLRGYLELGEPGRGEEGLRSGLVGPLVRDIVAAVKTQQQQGVQAGSSALCHVVDQTLSRLQSDAGPLLSELCAAGSALSGVDVLGAVLLAEVSQAVAEGMPGVFSPGNPTAFHSHYQAGQSLLDRLEGMAGSRAAVERLRNSTAAAGWAKRWNLSVYFSLIYQDIAGTFEAAAKGGQLQRADPEQQQQQQQCPKLQLSVSTSLWSCVQRCLSDDVFLLQLADKFTKLCCQLLVRYDTWLQEVWQHRQQAMQTAAAAGTGAAPGVQATAASGTAAAGTNGSNNSGVDGGDQVSVSGPAAWAGSLTAEDCAAICGDADVIQGLVVTHLSQQLSTRLHAHLPSDVAQQLQHMTQQVAANIAQHGQQVLLLLCGDVLDRCMSLVKQLKGITATYRMTAKGPPVRHSHYVAGVLQPLRQLLDTPGPVSQLSQNLKLLLSRDVIDSVNTRYSNLAEELLTTVKKTELSLKRLKKTRPGEAAGSQEGSGAAAAAGVGMSDSDKICLQLYLDVQEHGRQIAKFGLVADELESYRLLLAAVTPSDKQQQQDVSEQH